MSSQTCRNFGDLVRLHHSHLLWPVQAYEIAADRLATLYVSLERYVEVCRPNHFLAAAESVEVLFVGFPSSIYYTVSSTN